MGQTQAAGSVRSAARAAVAVTVGCVVVGMVAAPSISAWRRRSIAASDKEYNDAVGRQREAAMGAADGAVWDKVFPGWRIVSQVLGTIF